jgi:hypothetical protein
VPFDHSSVKVSRYIGYLGEIKNHTQQPRPYTLYPRPLVILLTVSNESWTLLAAEFALADVEWRVTEVLIQGGDGGSSEATVRPQLRYEVVLRRLDETLGVTGWSSRYTALGEAVACELAIGSVYKSAVAESTHVNKSTASRDAFVYAAELFGLVPPVSRLETYHADYDAETKTLLYEPEVTPGANRPVAKDARESTQVAKPQLVPEAPVKSAGQQAIDKLVERLEQQGRGKEVAKLIVRYGGYGQNPEAARELYSKLRALLVGQEGGSS